MKSTLVSLAFLSSVLASAQSGQGGSGIQVHVDYGFSPKVESKSIRGLDVGVALPLGTFLHSDLKIEPSFFGGSLFGGGNDSEVYRLTAFLHRTFARGVGARIGVGYSNSTRGDDLDGRSGVIFDLGVEIPFQFRLIQKLQPYADVHGILSTEDRLSGFFVGVGVRV